MAAEALAVGLEAEQGAFGGWQWGHTCPEQGPEPWGCVLWEGTGPRVRAGPRLSLILQQGWR